LKCHFRRKKTRMKNRMKEGEGGRRKRNKDDEE
jgi:hypothetical protein